MFSAPPNGELYADVFEGNIIQGTTPLLRPVLVYLSSRAVLLRRGRRSTKLAFPVSFGEKKFASFIMFFLF